MKKSLLLVLAAAGSISLCAENLWTGSQNVTWENTLYIGADKFASAEIGDEILVTVADGATDVIELKADGKWLPGTILTRLDGRTAIKATVTEAMKASLKAYGLELCGQSFTVTSVDLNTTDMYVPDGAVWAGFFWIDGGWNTLELFKTAFEGQEPEKIIINFSPEAEASTFELNVLTDWNEEKFKLSTTEALTIGTNQAVVDLTKLPEGRTFGYYFSEGQNALMVQGHVVEGNSFNITSIVVEPYRPLTGISTVGAGNATAVADVYNFAGVKVRSGVSATNATDGLRPGLYIINGKKVIVK